MAFDINKVTEAFKNLDGESLKKIGSLPLEVRLIFFVIGGIAAFVACYIILVIPLLQQITTLQVKEISLKKEYAELARKAPNLDLYEQQISELEETSKVILSLLPSRVDIDEILRDIYDVAEENKVKISRFDPDENEITKDFYKEIPIKMEVVSTYHNLGRFISDLAQIPRIVTLHNFSIRVNAGGAKSKQSNKHAPLQVSFVAKAYRYGSE